MEPQSAQYVKSDSVIQLSSLSNTAKQKIENTTLTLGRLIISNPSKTGCLLPSLSVVFEEQITKKDNWHRKVFV